MKRILFLIICIGGNSSVLLSQANTAITSGSIGKCAVWDYPYTLYNNSGATQYINTGVNVLVDQNRNIGAVGFNGNGAIDLSGANGITLSGTGSEINCRWDIDKNETYSMTNNNYIANNYGANYGTAFTFPYAGAYSWYRGSGWSANISGLILNAEIAINTSATPASASTNLFYKRQNVGCFTAGIFPTVPDTWISPVAISPQPAGATLQYVAAGYRGGGLACYNFLTITLGNAQIVYEN